MHYELIVASWLDLIIGPVYLLFIYLWASSRQKKMVRNYPAYKWFTRGLMAKCGGAIALALIYQFYYGGGDTVNYFYSARCIARVLDHNPEAFFRLLIGDQGWEAQGGFNNETGYPMYWNDDHGFFVARFCVPFCILSFHSFIGTSLLIATICYAGAWRLFLLFSYVFPNMDKQLAIALLFVPSVVFWGSGILKDTITLGAVGLFSAHFYSMFVQKKYTIPNGIYVSISVFLLIAIKPYILIALLPGSIIWLSKEQLQRIKNKALRNIITPLVYTTAVSLGYFTMVAMGDSLGDYSLDNVFEKAVISNQDQKQEYYGGNSFDIGDFDASAAGVSRKAHLAIFATLYRPMLFEAKNPFMLLSALENTYLLFLTLFLLVKLKFFGFFRYVRDYPLLTFSLLFALFFAFSVGIATSNFGTLVRVKIPCVPFFVASLMVMRHLYDTDYDKKGAKKFVVK
jgi:hypothetical protein